MPDEANEVCCSNPDDEPKLGLLLVILALIFMKDNVLSEGIYLVFITDLLVVHVNGVLQNVCVFRTTVGYIKKTWSC